MRLLRMSAEMGMAGDVGPALRKRLGATVCRTLGTGETAVSAGSSISAPMEDSGAWEADSGFGCGRAVVASAGATPVPGGCCCRSSCERGDWLGCGDAACRASVGPGLSPSWACAPGGLTRLGVAGVVATDAVCGGVERRCSHAAPSRSRRRQAAASVQPRRGMRVWRCIAALGAVRREAEGVAASEGGGEGKGFWRGASPGAARPRLAKAGPRGSGLEGSG